MRRTTMTVGLVLVLACDGDQPTDPPNPLDVRVFPQDVFAGGEIFLAGEWYRDSTRSFSLTLDTFSLTVRRVDDSTIAGAIPTTENGTLPLKERINGADVSRGNVSVHGLHRMASIPMLVEAELVPSRSPSLPYVITGDSLGVSVINARSDLVKRYPGMGRLLYDGSGCHRIPGQTYRDDTFIIWDSLVTWPPRNATRWQLIPDTVRGRSLLPFGCGVVEVSPQVFVNTGSEGAAAFVSLDSVDGSGNLIHFFSDTIIVNRGFFWSQDRMVLRGYNPQGVGVIDLENRRLAYRLPVIVDLASAAFSADETSLFLCGQDIQFGKRLLSISAATGDSLQGLFADCGSLAVDPDLGLLYVLVETNAGAALAVLDPTTLNQVGRIALPFISPADAGGDVILVDRENLDLIIVSLHPTISGVALVHVSLPASFQGVP